jgi:hypothetical protein
MSDAHHDIAPPAPTRQAIEAKGRSAPGKVTGKLKAAIGVMVWEGLKRPDAAAKAGLSDHGLREALRRPHVKAHYLSELEVLRTSERARNIHALVDVRDSSNQMARVQAVKALEQLSDDQQANAQRVQTPGLVIQINMQPGTAAPVVIDSDTSKQYQRLTRE